MSLNYKIWSEAEDQARLVIDEGEYRAQITTVTRKRTKSGQYEMLELTLALTDMQGRQRTLKDWVVFMDEMLYKLRHLAKSANLLDRYESGTLDIPHLIGAIVIAKIGIKDSDNGKMNTVKDYLTVNSNNIKSESLPIDNFNENDSIPF